MKNKKLKSYGRRTENVIKYATWVVYDSYGAQIVPLNWRYKNIIPADTECTWNDIRPEYGCISQLKAKCSGLKGMQSEGSEHIKPRPAYFFIFLTCWWMIRRVRYPGCKFPQPATGPGFPTRTWSGFPACSWRSRQRREGLLPLVYCHRSLRLWTNPSRNTWKKKSNWVRMLTFFDSIWARTACITVHILCVCRIFIPNRWNSRTAI